MSDKRLIDANVAIENADKCYREWNLAMAAAEGNRQINMVYKKQELFKAVKKWSKAVTPSTRKRCGLWRTSFMALCRKLRMESFVVGAGALLGWKPAMLPNTPLFAGCVAQRLRNNWRCT